MISIELKVKLHRAFKQLVKVCNLRVIFKISSYMKISSTLKTKLSENVTAATAAMLMILVKPNDIIEREPRNILVFHHSQGNVSKITLKLQTYIIICFFVRQVSVLKNFHFLLKAHVISNLRFRKVF